MASSRHSWHKYMYAVWPKKPAMQPLNTQRRQKPFLAVLLVPAACPPEAWAPQGPWHWALHLQKPPPLQEDLFGTPVGYDKPCGGMTQHLPS